MRALVCGDFMVDEYWYGSISRIAPEAPIPVFRHFRTERRSGGAANVAANLRAFGIDVSVLYSETSRVDPIVKIRKVVNDRYVGRDDFDYVQRPIDVDAIAHASVGVDVVVFSDYGKGTLDNIQALIRGCGSALVFVDPKSRQYKEYSGATMIKPNLDELRLLIGGWRDEQDMERKVNYMQRNADICHVLVTRGAQGMTLFSRAGDGCIRHDEPAVKCGNVVDTCGAGDTVLAAFVAYFASVSNDSADYYAVMHSAMRYASHAAGIAVSRFGTAVVSKEDMDGKA